MGIGKRIKEARLAKNMTQEDLAYKLGITKSAVANYESETSHPKELILYKLFSVLSVDANYLYQDIDGMTPSDIILTDEEKFFLKSFRDLDSYQKETIRIIMEREINYSNTIKSKSSNNAALSESINYHHIDDRNITLSDTDIIQLYPYMHNIASAGTSLYSDDIPIDTIEVPYMKDADFIIGVSGDSMEPEFHNGDLLYIKKTDQLNLDEIGIFSKNNNIYIKKVGRDRLISINRAYPDIYPEDGNINTIGRVLGKVER